MKTFSNVLILCVFVSASLSILLTTSAQQTPTDIPTATNNYNLSYSIDTQTLSVTFEITGRTTGYIAFGFTNISGMVQADIFMGGVYQNGTSYFGDYTSYDASTPRLDAQQDWNLLNATEADGITYVKFSRRLSTGDPVDIEIRDALMNIIWSLGPANDAFLYHGFSRSTLKFNLASGTNGGEEPIPPPGF